jgi:hypothetical protein
MMKGKDIKREFTIKANILSVILGLGVEVMFVNPPTTGGFCIDCI